MKKKDLINELEHAKEMLNSYDEMMLFKKETNYYGYSKSFHHFIEDLIDWHNIIKNLLENVIKRLDER